MEDSKPSAVVYNIFLDEEKDNSNSPLFDSDVARETFRLIGEAWAARSKRGSNFIPSILNVTYTSDIKNILKLGTEGIRLVGEIARGYIEQLQIEEQNIKKVEMPEIQ